MKNIVILISGSGSNMAAIARTAQQENWQNTWGARIATGISKKPDCQGLAGGPVTRTVRAGYGQRDLVEMWNALGWFGNGIAY